MTFNTLQELFRQGVSILQGVVEPSHEAKLLLLRAAGLDDMAFHTDPHYCLSSRVKESYFRLLRRRLRGEPLGYITGRKEFWSLLFKVGPGVLIPRPETELLVEKVVSLSRGGGETLLDMGTGCGNIAVALARELPDARITAVDISAKALKIAAANASAHACRRIRFIRSDLFSAFGAPRARFDVIVSNPPYVSREEWERLPPEIRDHEPRRALVGGEKGLEFIKRLIRVSGPRLRPGGYLVFEIGAGQHESVLSCFDLGKRWEKPAVFPDLSGWERVVIARKRGRASERSIPSPPSRRIR